MNAATAVFDGVGGELLGQIAPTLPMNSTLYCYGFLGAATVFPLQTVRVMMKNLTIRRFSNFESSTVKEPAKLIAALETLESLIDDPAFTTRIGQTFSFEQIESAMAYESSPGDKAVLLA